MMETLLGVVYKVLWSSVEKDNNYKVFILRKNNGRYDTISGDFPELIEGVSLEIHGDYKDHPKYGRGFRAKAHTFTYEKTSTISISYYLQSITKFIGPTRSHDIAAYFGENLEDIIENHPERLLEVPNVGQVVADNLVKSWREHREEKNVKIFLFSLGLTELKVKKILLHFGIEAEGKIKENPFLLCFVGFGFTTCDFIAQKLRVPSDSPLRFTQYVLYTLKEALNSGHLYLHDYQILHAINTYNESTSYKFKKSEIILPDIEGYLKKLEEDGFLIKDEDRYYELHSYFYESESARILSLIAGKEDTCNYEGEDIEIFIKDYEQTQQDPNDKESFQLSEEQRDAVRSFIKEKILIITGSPGTGKTTILKAFVQYMKNHHTTFELLTPTGIASKRLGATAGCDAYTIHRRLGYKGDAWDYNTSNKYSTQVVIIDEMSMVDMDVFYHLVSALYTHTKLVFVGDNDQLPSVGPGRVLNELIKSGVIKTILLKNIFRQEKQSDIIKEAKKIREGDTDLSLFKGEKTADIWFLRNSSTKILENTVVKFATQLKDQIKRSGIKKTFQIITPRNSGPLSVATLNAVLQESLNPKKPEERELNLNNNCVIRKGDRVLVKKNNYQLGVFNGDIGKVKMITSSAVYLAVDDYEGIKEVEVPIEVAEETLKLAYAITVHKSQGGEYDLIILPIVKAHGKRILQRNLLYTAITRARKKVIILGQGSAIVDAIENDKIQERNTLFAERIQKWMKKEGTTLQELYTNPNDYQNAKNLKQLLLYEERASVESAITEQLPEKEPKSQLKPPQCSEPLENLSLDQVIEELTRDLEKRETPKKEELPF
jgi:exodeoxyribonuclease V alpha subunit